MVDVSFRRHHEHLTYIPFSIVNRETVVGNVVKWHGDVETSRYLDIVLTEASRKFLTRDTYAWFNEVLEKPRVQNYLINYDANPIGYVNIDAKGLNWFEMGLVIDKGIGIEVLVLV